MESIIKHEKIATEESRLKVFREAKDFFAENTREGKSKQDLSTDATLYIYTLLNKGYFNNYLLPKMSFYQEDTDSDGKIASKNLVGRVYGRYFLFYEYIKGQAEKLGIYFNNEKVETLSAVPQKPSSKKKINKQSTLRQIWKGSEKEWENVVTFLQRPYNKTEANKRSSSFNLPWIEVKKSGELNWTKIGISAFQKYLAGFIIVCIKRGYIENQYTGPEMAAICCNTFKNLTVLERSNFSHLDYYSEIDEYQKPFLNLPTKK